MSLAKDWRTKHIHHPTEQLSTSSHLHDAEIEIKFNNVEMIKARSFLMAWMIRCRIENYNNIYRELHSSAITQLLVIREAITKRWKNVE